MLGKFELCLCLCVCILYSVVPLQWIYDVDKLKGIVGDKDPVFWPESKCPFFKVPTGRNSCYGDIVGVSLKSLVDRKGDYAVDCPQTLCVHVCIAVLCHRPPQ